MPATSSPSAVSPDTTTRARTKHTPPPIDGRDEMNLADFPISILDHRQPRRIDGGKVDTIVYEASRFDPVSQRRVPQRVVLLTNSQIGLPTPTDENVVLGLLCLAKKSSDFTSPKVNFVPNALMSVLRWAPDGRSYRRLRDSLRRLKALTIRYENAWWDTDGRMYQQEFATGIIGEYHLASQVRGERSGGSVPENFVIWSPRFFESLQRGNLKRLDLERLFALKLPTSQRMFRFLDKRFHAASVLDMDLHEFACGHIGLTPTTNVAQLKQRLEPPIQELEGIGFLEKRPGEQRYRKLAPKLWRIQLQRGNGQKEALPATTDGVTKPGVASATNVPSPESEIVADFYRDYAADILHRPTAKELQLAKDIIEAHGVAKGKAIVAAVIKRLKTKWPDAKTFGAIAVYLQEAIADCAKREAATERRQKAEQSEIQESSQEAVRTKVQAAVRREWEMLAESERESIRGAVIKSQPRSILKFPGILERMCIEEWTRRKEAPGSAVAIDGVGPKM